MGPLRQIWAILKKDLILELRTKEMLISMFLFVMLTMVVFNYAFKAEKVDLTPFGGGMLWLAFTFTAILGLNRSFVHEKDEGCLEGLLLSPIDRSLIYVAKVLGNFLFLTLVEIVAIPIFTIFFVRYNYFPKLGLFIIGVILSNIGISAVGTFLATIAINTKTRDLLLPLLFLPIIVPVLASAVIVSGAIMAGPLSKSLGEQVKTSVQLLLIYDIVFFVAAYALYEFILGE